MPSVTVLSSVAIGAIVGAVLLYLLWTRSTRSARKLGGAEVELELMRLGDKAQEAQHEEMRHQRGRLVDRARRFMRFI